jgi:hypothetical protein
MTQGPRASLEAHVVARDPSTHDRRRRLGPGEFTSDGAGACQACAAGTYKAGSGNEACTDCGAGKYSAASGATAESTCSACTSNSDAPAGSDDASDCICNAGFTSDGAGGCAQSDPTGNAMHTCTMRWCACEPTANMASGARKYATTFVLVCVHFCARDARICQTLLPRCMRRRVYERRHWRVSGVCRWHV